MQEFIKLPVDIQERCIGAQKRYFYTDHNNYYYYVLLQLSVKSMASNKKTSDGCKSPPATQNGDNGNEERPMLRVHYGKARAASALGSSRNKIELASRATRKRINQVIQNMSHS
jgi:hypothetical protein